MRKLLDEIELFRDLAAEERDQVAWLLTPKKLAEGEVLFREGDPQDGLYLIYEGAIELSRTDIFGATRNLVTFEGRDFLGEGALLDESPHSVTARALRESTVGRLGREDFARLLGESPSVASRLLSRIARVITRRMQAVTDRSSLEAAQYRSGGTRSEHDLLGDRDVPDQAYYGIQTLRGLENFAITGVPISHYPRLIEALAMVKVAAAIANKKLGLLPGRIAAAIIQAGREIVRGKLHGHFALDTIQGGAGTSTNMNANEVIANRANEILGGRRGDTTLVHPLNHVNCSQSTNDVYPTALKLAMVMMNRDLSDAVRSLVTALSGKAREFARTLTLGRTQLQDAVPMTLGQEFEAFAVTMRDEAARLDRAADALLTVNLGGTAIGTGLNAPPEFGTKAVGQLRIASGLDVRLAENLIEETQDTGSFVMYSATLKSLAVKLSKMCNDLRLLSSGPRGGLNEINLPAVQPGSTIMPGKVNPVIPEVVNQVAFKVIGNDLAVTMAAEAGQLQLNVMEPLIGQCIFESVEMLKNGISTLVHRCIQGITANEEVCRNYARRSIGLVTALAPVLGYETSTRIAREAQESGKGIYDLVLEQGLLTEEQLDRLLDPETMLRPWRGSR